MSNKQAETRNFQLRAYDGGSAADPQMLLRGRAASYGVLSHPLNGFRERLQAGCFSRCLATNPDVKCLIQHDASRVLGRTTSGTLRLDDGPSGLDFTCKLDPNQEEHRSIYSGVKRGDWDSCSFAFLPDGDDAEDWDEGEDEKGERFCRRTIKRAKLFDCSIVQGPAYPETSVSARNVGQHRQTRDADRLRLAVIADKIRRDDITHASCRAVRLGPDGLFHRDFAREAELARFATREAELAMMWTDFSPEGCAAIRALLGDAPPREPLTGEGAYSVDEHKDAVEKHTTIAKNRTLRGDKAGAFRHHTAADAHKAAARCFTYQASVDARASSIVANAGSN
jgi:Escherichia/Staphylococcus phage prohead protease